MHLNRRELIRQYSLEHRQKSFSHSLLLNVNEPQACTHLLAHRALICSGSEELDSPESSIYFWGKKMTSFHAQKFSKGFYGN